MSAPVHTSAVGQAFWQNVRLGNLTGEFYERELEDGTKTGSLLPGHYHPRPNSPSPLDSNITRNGLIRLRFRVKGGRPDLVKEVKIEWNYISHGQNRDSMLAKLLQPTVFSILNLLEHLNIPETEEERQSATVLEKERAAKDALKLIRGVEADWGHPTDQVHIILKLHRVIGRWENIECGNAYDYEFLKSGMMTTNWHAFPVPLAFNLHTLISHLPESCYPATRRSLLATEATGDGTTVTRFLNGRFANPLRYPPKETMQILFSVFKYVLKLQLDTLRTEGSILGDLHSENITVMGGRSGGRVPGDEGLKFALVDCSGLLPVVGKNEIVTGKLLKGHLNCFVSFWSIPHESGGVISGYAQEVWTKMLAIGTAFSTEFRSQQWRAVEIMENLMTECIRLEAKFSDGFDLYEQCQQMKKEAMAAALKRSLPPAPFPQYQKPRDPLAHCWEQEWRRATPPWDAPGTGTARAKAEGRVPEPAGKGKALLHPAGTPPRNQRQRKAAPAPPAGVPEPKPPPGHQQARVPEPAGPPPGYQKGRVPEPMGPPLAPKHPGKTKFDDREPVADGREPPAKKSFSSASAPARPDAGLGGFMDQEAADSRKASHLLKSQQKRIWQQARAATSIRPWSERARKARASPRATTSTQPSSERAVQATLILLC